MSTTHLVLTAHLYARSSRGRDCRRRVGRHQSLRARRRARHYTTVCISSLLLS